MESSHRLDSPLRPAAAPFITLDSWSLGVRTADVCTRATPPLVVPQQNVFALLFNLARPNCIPTLMVHFCHANAMGPWCFTRTKRPSLMRNTNASQASPRGSHTCRHMDLTKRWPLSELWTGKDFFFCALRYALTHGPTDDICKAVVPVCLRHSRDRIYVRTCSRGVYEEGEGMHRARGSMQIHDGR